MTVSAYSHRQRRRRSGWERRAGGPAIWHRPASNVVAEMTMTLLYLAVVINSGRSYNSKPRQQAFSPVKVIMQWYLNRHPATPNTQQHRHGSSLPLVIKLQLLALLLLILVVLLALLIVAAPPAFSRPLVALRERQTRA